MGVDKKRKRGQPSRLDDPVRREKTKRLAYLLGEGLSKAEVKRLLGFVGQDFSKALRDAKDQRWLHEGFNCTLNESERRKHEFEVHGGDKIKKRLNEIASQNNPCLEGDAIKAVHIFTTQETRTSSDSKFNWENRALDFGEQAATAWLKYIVSSEVCGTVFSRQLASLVRGVEQTIDFRASELIKTLAPAKKRINFIPCWGDGVLPQQEVDERWDRWEISASGIAANLNKQVNERLLKLKHKPSLTLQNVPLLRRKRFNKQKFANVLEFYGKISDYITIFGKNKINDLLQVRKSVKPRDGLIWNVDCLLTAIGGTDPPGTIWADEFFRLAGLNESEKAELLSEVSGDLGGVWLPRENVHCKRVNELRDLWTCINQEMIRECARKGREDGKVGLVTVAVGSERSEATIVAATVLLC